MFDEEGGRWWKPCAISFGVFVGLLVLQRGRILNLSTTTQSDHDSTGSFVNVVFQYQGTFERPQYYFRVVKGILDKTNVSCETDEHTDTAHCTAIRHPHYMHVASYKSTRTNLYYNKTDHTLRTIVGWPPYGTQATNMTVVYRYYNYSMGNDLKELRQRFVMCAASPGMIVDFLGNLLYHGILWRGGFSTLQCVQDILIAWNYTGETHWRSTLIAIIPPRFDQYEILAQSKYEESGVGISNSLQNTQTNIVYSYLYTHVGVHVVHEGRVTTVLRTQTRKTGVVPCGIVGLDNEVVCETHFYTREPDTVHILHGIEIGATLQNVGRMVAPQTPSPFPTAVGGVDSLLLFESLNKYRVIKHTLLSLCAAQASTANPNRAIIYCHRENVEQLHNQLWMVNTAQPVPIPIMHNMHVFHPVACLGYFYWTAKNSSSSEMILCISDGTAKGTHTIATIELERERDGIALAHCRQAADMVVVRKRQGVVGIVTSAYPKVVQTTNFHQNMVLQDASNAVISY